MAPPYAVTEDMNGAKPVVKTCYRCKKDGHVRLLPIRSRLFFPALTFFFSRLQIAKDCTEGQEPVEVAEDTTWGAVQDDPWGDTALPADGTMH